MSTHAGSGLTSIAVFCGSNRGRLDAYRAAAREFGRRVAQAGIHLIYGGGRVGLMGELADAALADGAEVTGVMPKHLVDREIAHEGLSSLIVVSDMHERKAAMAERADAFVALPGGPGTMEEFFEAWVWRQLGLHAKPVGLLNAAGYYDSLSRFLDHMIGEGFMAEDYRRMIAIENAPERLLERLQAR